MNVIFLFRDGTIKTVTDRLFQSLKKIVCLLFIAFYRIYNICYEDIKKNFYQCINFYNSEHKITIASWSILKKKLFS